MVILNQKVKVKWHPRNKEYYINLGYKYTIMGKEFEVDLKDLTKGSKSLIKIKCDYCGKIIQVKYQNYTHRYSPNLKDACNKCKTKKMLDSNFVNYGKKCVFELDSIKEKSKNTSLLKYGVEHYSQTFTFKNTVPLKIRKTMFNNGTVPTSSQQLQLYSLLKNLFDNCELNYPCGPCSLDCMIKIENTIIDIEYDGSYWHQDKQKDRKRDEFVKTKGYKILRIKSKRDIPSEEKILKAIDCLVKSNHSYIEINL